MCKHLEDNREVSKGQHELVENKTLQNSLMSTYNRVGGLVDRRQSIDYGFLSTLVRILTLSLVIFS